MILLLEEALDIDHALLAQVERLLKPYHLLLVALHDNVRRHLVILRHNLDGDLVGALGVIEVKLASDGRDECGEVPVVPKPAAEGLLLEDRQDERERAESNERAKC